MVLGKLNSYMQKNETWPLSHTIHKDQLQMDERPRCETEIHQNQEENIDSNLYNISQSNIFMTHLQRKEKQKIEWTCGTSSR